MDEETNEFIGGSWIVEVDCQSGKLKTDLHFVPEM